MATPPHDGSARGATSMDDVHALPSRPESFGRPVVLAVDETVPARHRSRRNRGAHGPTPQVPEERMGFFASTVLAVVSLVFVAVVALGSMLASAAILHLISPDRRFDTFRAFHEPLVIGVLLVSVCSGSSRRTRGQRSPRRASRSSDVIFDRRRPPDGALRRTGVAVRTGGVSPPRLAAAGRTGFGPCQQQRCCGSGRRGTPAPPDRIKGERCCSFAAPENRRFSVPWATC